MSKKTTQKEAAPSPAKLPVEKPAWPQELIMWMTTEPVLREKLIEAIQTQQFFITVSFQKKKRPEDKDDFQHVYVQKGYPEHHVVQSLRHVASDWTAKNYPTGELPDHTQWH